MHVWPCISPLFSLFCSQQCLFSTPDQSQTVTMIIHCSCRYVQCILASTTRKWKTDKRPTSIQLSGGRPANYELRRVHACILWRRGGGAAATRHRRFPAGRPAVRPSYSPTNYIPCATQASLLRRRRPSCSIDHPEFQVVYTLSTQ